MNLLSSPKVRKMQSYVNTVEMMKAEGRPMDSRISWHEDSPDGIMQFQKPLITLTGPPRNTVCQFKYWTPWHEFLYFSERCQTLMCQYSFSPLPSFVATNEVPSLISECMFTIVTHEFGNVGPMSPYLKEHLSNPNSNHYQHRMAMFT